MSDLDWEEIKIFLAIVNTGSFAKAAESMGMTQPTISRKIANLEEKVGGLLFERSPTGTTLTERGTALVTPARKMAKSAQDFQQISTATSDETTGTVRITAPDGLTTILIMPELINFHTTHPNLSIFLNAGPNQTDTEGPAYDLSLGFTDPPDDNLVRSPVCWIHYSYFASPAYIAEFGMPQRFGDLLSHRLITHSLWVDHKEVWDASTEAIEALRDKKLTFVSNSSPINIQAVRSGLGIGIMSTAAVARLPDLQPLPLGRAASARLYMYYSKNSENISRVKACKDWLRDIFSSESIRWFSEDYVDPYEWVQGEKTVS